MAKATTATAKPWRKVAHRRRRPHPLNVQKKLGPKEQHK
jgi:hypothetical protein